MTSPEDLMDLAIAKAREGINNGQSPFGCAIGCGDELLAVCHNRVRATTDITAHAEIVAVREACRVRGEIFLNGCIAVTTCEPCPMCMAALHWARVETVFYGATIADASGAGFNELTVPAVELLRMGNSRVKLVPGIRRDECRALFEEWRSSPAYAPY